jgi:putative oxidoreductase
MSPMSRMSNPALGLAILRLVVGIVFTVHGAQKLFTFGYAGTAAFFTQAGIPLPGISAAIVIAVEFLGGIALILGLGTRIAALFIAIDMLGAMLFVHLAGGFFMPKGYEFALTLCAAAIALMLAGPGAASLDGMMGRSKGTAE